jgi:hypothetical protein
MHRRQLLGYLAGLGTAWTAGCGSTPSRRGPRRGTSPATAGDPTTTPSSKRDYRHPVLSRDPSTVASAWGLDEVANLGDLGADKNAETPIDELLATHATDGTLLYFPPGKYRIEETVAVNGDGRIGLLGDDAVIVPPAGFDSTVLAVGYPDPMTALFVRGLTFDYRAENTGGRPVLGLANDLILYRDLSVRGVVDVAGDIVRLDVTSPDGIGIVDGLSLPDGATVPSVTGCEVGDNNHGDVEFYDCHIAGFPDNGLYADPPEGSIRVYGGFFRNNGVAGVRITTSEPSLVHGARVRCDDSDAVGVNMRGIRLRGGYDHLVEDCVVELLDVTSSDGAVTIASELASATIRNCHLHVDADGVNAIRVKSPNDDADEAVREGPFRFENVRITGNAADSAAVQAADRRGCTFENLQIHQSGDDRDGIVTTNVEGELFDSCISVTKDPLSLRSSQIERRNVRVDNDPETERCGTDRSPIDGTPTLPE